VWLAGHKLLVRLPAPFSLVVFFCHEIHSVNWFLGTMAGGESRVNTRQRAEHGGAVWLARCKLLVRDCPPSVFLPLTPSLAHALHTPPFTPPLSSTHNFCSMTSHLDLTRLSSPTQVFPATTGARPPLRCSAQASLLPERRHARAAATMRDARLSRHTGAGESGSGPVRNRNIPAAPRRTRAPDAPVPAYVAVLSTKIETRAAHRTGPA
jgi:hypothetical protein